MTTTGNSALPGFGASTSKEVCFRGRRTVGPMLLQDRAEWEAGRGPSDCRPTLSAPSGETEVEGKPGRRGAWLKGRPQIPTPPVLTLSVFFSLLRRRQPP